MTFIFEKKNLCPYIILVGVVTSTEYFFSGEFTVHMLLFFINMTFLWLVSACMNFFSDIILAHAFFWQ